MAGMEPEVLLLEDVLEDMAKDLKASFGLPQGLRTYRLWGEDSYELETALYDMMKHLPKEERDLLRRYLNNLVENVYQNGYNVVVFAATEEGLYAKGASFKVQTLPEARVVS